MDIKAAFPHVIGFDGAGTVTAVGEDVTGLAADDRVYAARYMNPPGGFYSECVVTDAGYAGWCRPRAPHRGSPAGRS
ncbi:MAG: alcohol dehydrogenase catalytic domain-containing protein [Egibacteraceae bacterium]